MPKTHCVDKELWDRQDDFVFIVLYRKNMDKLNQTTIKNLTKQTTNANVFKVVHLKINQQNKGDQK